MGRRGWRCRRWRQFAAPVPVDAVGEQQGRLPHGGQGLVGTHHHRVRSPVGIHPQKLQMGSVGTVHHQFSTVGVDYSRNGGISDNNPQ